MKRRRRLVCGLAVGLLICLTAASDSPAAPKKGKPKAGKRKAKDKAGKKQKGKKQGKSKPKAAANAGKVSFATMKRELNLKPRQAAKLRGLWQQRDGALADWDASPEGMSLVQLREKLILTPGPGRATVAGQVRSLQAQRDQIAHRYDAKILAVLTAQQRVKWLGFLLYRRVLNRSSEMAVHLTAEQGRQARAVCNRVAKTLPAAPDSAAMARAAAEAAREIFAEVFTDKQRKTAEPGYESERKGRSKSRSKSRSKGRNRGRSRSGNKRGRRRGGRGRGMRGKLKSARGGSKGAKPGGEGGGKPVAKPKTMGIGRSKASQLKPKGNTATKARGPKVMDLHRSDKTQPKPKGKE